MDNSEDNEAMKVPKEIEAPFSDIWFLEPYPFIRIPKALIWGENYCNLSPQAKLIYGILLDRVGLSLKNGWITEDKTYFVYLSLKTVEACLGVGHDKASSIFKELHRYGLVQRTLQGRGKPARIVVNPFVDTTDKGTTQSAK